MLILFASLAMTVQDLYDGSGSNIGKNLKMAFLLFGATFIAAPLGIDLLFKIYGIHYLILGVFIFSIKIYGFIRSKRLHGQILAVSGILVWMVLGAYGLGHGG